MPAEYPTLMDVARRSGDSSISAIVEILNKTNSILDDIPWKECNSGVTHITTIRTGIPKPAWRMLNSGVPLAKSTTKQIKAGCGMLEVYSEVDEDQVNLAKRNGSSTGAADFLASENAAFIEGFGQEIARVIFYGDPSDPKEPVGLINYYNDKSSEAGKDHLIDAGGTGDDNTSIWLIQWGERAIHGLYPQGSKAGLSEKYLGVHTVKDDSGSQFQAHRTHYKWDNGLVVRDWHSAVRIANLSMAKLTGNVASDAPDIISLLTRAVYQLPQSSASVRTAIYCRKEILTALDLQVQRKSNLMLNYETVFGRKCITFRGIPLREQETLLDTEAHVG